MTSKQLTNIASSVKQRLLLKRSSSHRTFDEVLQYYAIERFLYRLSKDDFVKLKQRQWKAFHKRIDLQSVPEDFTDIMDTVKLFLYQVTDAIYNSKQVLTGTWKAPGPWSNC